MVNFNQKKICLLVASSFISSLTMADDEILMLAQNTDSPVPSGVERVIEPIKHPYPSVEPMPAPVYQDQEPTEYTELDNVTIKDQRVKVVEYDVEDCDCSEVSAIAAAVLQGSLLVGGISGSNGEDRSELAKIGYMLKPESAGEFNERFRDEMRFEESSITLYLALARAINDPSIVTLIPASLLSLAATSLPLSGASLASAHLISLSGLSTSILVKTLSSTLSLGLSSLASLATLGSSLATLSLAAASIYSILTPFSSLLLPVNSVGSILSSIPVSSASLLSTSALPLGFSVSSSSANPLLLSALITTSLTSTSLLSSTLSTLAPSSAFTSSSINSVKSVLLSSSIPSILMSVPAVLSSAPALVSSALAFRNSLVASLLVSSSLLSSLTPSLLLSASTLIPLGSSIISSGVTASLGFFYPLIVFTSSVTLFTFLGVVGLGATLASFGSGIFSVLSVPVNSVGGFILGSSSLVASIPVATLAIGSFQTASASFASSMTIPESFVTSALTSSLTGGVLVGLGGISLVSGLLTSALSAEGSLAIFSSPILLGSAALYLSSTISLLVPATSSVVSAIVGWTVSASFVTKSMLESTSILSLSTFPLITSSSLLLLPSSVLSTSIGLSSSSNFVPPLVLSASSAVLSVPSIVLSLMDAGLASMASLASVLAPLGSSIFTILPVASMGVFFVGGSIVSVGLGSISSLVLPISLLGGSVIGPIVSASSIPALFSAGVIFSAVSLSAPLILLASVPFGISAVSMLEIFSLNASSAFSSALISLPSATLAISGSLSTLLIGVPSLLLASASAPLLALSSVLLLSSISSSWVPLVHSSYVLGSSITSSLTPFSIFVPSLVSSSLPLSLSSVPSLLSTAPSITSMLSSGILSAVSTKSSFFSLGMSSGSLLLLNPVSVSSLPVVSSLAPATGLSLLSTASLSHILGSSSILPSLFSAPFLSGLGSTSLVVGLLWPALSFGITFSSVLPSVGSSLIPTTLLLSSVTSSIGLLTTSSLKSSLLQGSSSVVSQLSSVSMLSFIPAYVLGTSAIISSLAPISSVPASISGPLLGSISSVANLGLSATSSVVDSSGKVLSSIFLLPISLPVSVNLSSALTALTFSLASASLGIPPLATLSFASLLSSLALNSSTAPLGLSFSGVAGPLSLVSAIPSVLSIAPAIMVSFLTGLSLPSGVIPGSIALSASGLASVLGLPAFSSVVSASLQSSLALGSVSVGLSSLLLGVSAYYSLLVSILSPLSVVLFPSVAVSALATTGVYSMTSILGGTSGAFSATFSFGISMTLPTISTSVLASSSMANPSFLLSVPFTSMAAIASMVTGVTSALFLAFGVVAFISFLPVSSLAVAFSLPTISSGIPTSSSFLVPVLPLSSSALISTSLSSATFLPSAMVPLALSVGSGSLGFVSAIMPVSVSSVASVSALPSLAVSGGFTLASSIFALGLPFYTSLSSGLGLFSAIPPQSSSISLSASVVPSSLVASTGAYLASIGSSSVPGLAPAALLSSSAGGGSIVTAFLSLSTLISSVPSLAVSVPFKSSASSLVGLSSVNSSSLIPISSSAGPISSSLLPSSAPFASSFAVPASLSSSWTPSGSAFPSLVSGLPSSSASAPSVSETSIIGPSVSVGITGISFKILGPQRQSNWKYGFHDYDYDGYYSDNFEFKNLVTFGDSLSDTGSHGRGSIYMADGNPYVFYNSYLSLALTGKPITPERFGGANYAMSGAVLRNDVFDPMSWVIPRDSLKAQVSRYFDRNGGVANYDDAFVIWGGGNDVTVDIQYAILDSSKWNIILNGASGEPYLNDKALFPGILAQKLIDRGATNSPIFVLNLPSSAITPFTGVLAESMLDIGILTGGTPVDLLNVGGWLMKAQDSYLRNPANRVGDLGAGNGIAYFKENNINAIQARYPFIPRALIETYFNTVFNAQNNVVDWFNQAVNGRVEQVTGGNVVQLDIYGLFVEVMDNPLFYGIDEILVPECGIGHVAPACDVGDDYYHGDDARRYMYTDWHHPSALMHRMIAEYALATVNAPAYITGLSRSLETGAKARQDYLLSELIRINARPYEGQGQSYVFGGFSGGYSKQSRSLNNRALNYGGLNIGYGYRPSEGIDIGVMGSLGLSKMKPHKTFKYNQQDLGITAFAQYTNGPWWVNGMLSAANTKFDKINRTVHLGDMARSERSDTRGKTYGGRIEMGHEFLVSDTWVVAPILAYTSYRYEVDEFEEDGSSSTAMRFKKQKHNQKYVSAGVRISDDCPDDSVFMRASIDITANRTIKNKDEQLIGVGGLKRYNTTFSREANRLVKDSKTWIEVKPTVQWKVNKNSRITTAVNYSFDKSKNKNKNLSYSVGYRYEF